MEKLRNLNTGLEEEISRFKAREILLQREIDILIKSLKNQKLAPETATPVETEHEEFLESGVFDSGRETISENYPEFSTPQKADDEDLGLSPSTILRLLREGG